MDIIDLSDIELPDKEKRILEASIKVFSEKGFSAATTNEIAKTAGVAEGTIFRYFKTKKDILRGILIQTINLVSGKIVVSSIEKIIENAEDKDIRVVLKEVLYDRLKLVDSFFPMARVIFTEALFHEDVRDAIYENIILRALTLFKNFSKKMIEKGEIRDDIEPESILRTILGSFAVLLIQNKFFSDKFEITDLDKEFDNVIEILLNGIGNRKP